MSLNNIESSSGELVATDYNGDAVSEPIIQSDGNVSKILEENLVAHYLLNNNSHDCYGSYDGTDTSMTYTGDVGEFNGSTGAISLGDNFNTVLSGDFTINLWVDAIAVGGSLFSKGDWVGDGEYLRLYIRDTAPYIQFGFEDGASNDVAMSTNNEDILGTGIRMITAMCSDGNYWKLFLDRVEIESVVPNGTMSMVNTISAYIGTRTPFVNYFNGDISNFRLYSDVKDQTFIDELYDEGYYPKPLTAPTTDGLIAHYPFTGTAKDTTGNYDGTEVGNTYVDNSEFGSIGRFTNNNGTASAPTSQVTIPQQLLTTFTISFWASVDTPTNMNMILSKNADVAYYHFIRLRSDNTLDIAIANTFSSTIQSDHSTSEKLFTVTRDGDSFSLFVEGEYVNTGTCGTDTLDISLIGSLFSSNDSSANFKGNLRNVRLYNVVLTAQEIEDIYNYEKNFRSIDIDDGLVAFYPLKNNSLDNYYNEYDGTDTDMTYSNDVAGFNGSTSKINVDNIPVNNTIHTVSLWVKPNELDRIQALFTFWKYWNITILLKDDNYLEFSRYIGSSLNVYSTEIVELDKWVHIVCTYSNVTDDMTISINGVINDTLNNTNVTSSRATETSIGKGDGSYPRYFNGEIGHFRYFTKVLTTEQIQIIYDEENLDEHISIELGSPELDYSRLKNISADFDYEDISEQSSIADTFDTSSPIEIGDNIAILMNDDSIVTTEIENISSGRQVRYVRNYLNGNTINTSSHWVEIEAIEYDTGINVGLSSSGAIVSGSFSADFSIINNGIVSNVGGEYIGIVGEAHVVLDLGSVYEIENIIMYHYYGDSRIYNWNKLEVSIDGIEWRTLFDTQASDLEYVESSAGKSIYLPEFSVDLSNTMNGEVPSSVCAIDSKLSFNDIEGYTEPVIIEDDYDFMHKRIESVDYFNDGSGIALWKLDRDGTEVGGNYDSTGLGTVLWSGTAPFAGQTCLYSNNSGALKTGLIVLPQTVSVSFWHYSVNPSSDSGSKFIFSFMYNGTAIFAFTNHQTIDTGTDTYLVYYNGNWQRVGGIGYGSWNHFVLTSTGKFYRQGVLIYTFPEIPDMSIVNQELNIHTHINSSSYYACGYTSMFRVFGKEISDDEVLDLYQNEQLEYFKNTRSYYNVRLEGRSIETKVELQNPGDKCTRIEADIYKQAEYDNLLTVGGDSFITSSGDNFRVVR